jgi:hypothetical protein
MKWIRLPAPVMIAWILGCAVAHSQDLAVYKTVYILPMSNGLDQFLAIKLTGARMIQVVADPKKADVVFTDHIGAGFEDRLDELYGPKPQTDDKDNLTASTPRISSGSHGKGTIFLVDRKTRVIVWSVYVKPKNTSQDEMNHVAERIAEKFEKDKKAK